MTDINGLVEEFWKTSNNGAVGVSFFAMRRLFKILEVCFDIISVFATAVDLADKYLQMAYRQSPNLEYRFGDKYKITFDGYRKMLDQSFSKSKDLGDMLRLLPGVLVQKMHISMQGMADLYRIKPDLLERFIKSSILIEHWQLKPSRRYIFKLDGYLSRFLQDRDRSQLYYCDPMLQHISICRRLLSLLDGSNDFDLQS